MSDPQTFLEVVIDGPPVPKARPRTGRNGNTYTPRRTLDHEERIAKAARNVLRGRKPTTAPVAVSVTFYVPGRRKGDVDNYLKTTLDGLNEIAWGDDSQVVHADAWVILDRANPRTEVSITTLPGAPTALGDQTPTPRTRVQRRASVRARAQQILSALPPENDLAVELRRADLLAALQDKRSTVRVTAARRRPQ